MRSLAVVALGIAAAAAVLSLPCQADTRSPTAPVLTRDSVCSAPTPSRLTVRSGVNEVLAIARGQVAFQIWTSHEYSKFISVDK